MDIEYFMDKCTTWEINDIIINIPFLDRNMWETSRLNAFVTAKVGGAKNIDFKDICKFKWEEEIKQASDYEISNEEIERLKKLSKQWEKESTQSVTLKNTATE